MNAQFTDALAHWADITGIAKRQSIDPGRDLRLADDIPQRFEPAPELIGFANLHRKQSYH
jgi:hypothetical protein